SLPVNRFHLQQGEVLLSLLGRTDRTLHGITSLEAEKFYLRGRHINVVGGCEVVVIRRTQEPVAILHDLQRTFIADGPVEVANGTLSHLRLLLAVFLRRSV